MFPTIASKRRAIGFPQQDNNFSERFILAGGLNIEEPTPNGDAGKLIFCQNFEPNFDGGYRSKGGFEPVDGHRQPSAYYYQALKVDHFIGTAGNKPNQKFVDVTGNTSGAVQQFLAFETINGATYLILTRVLTSLITAQWGGTLHDQVDFIPGETVHTSLGDFAVLSSDADMATTTPNIGLAGTYIAAARDFQRNRIKPIGNTAASGRALGAFDFNGALYGIRNNSAGTSGAIWMATGSGWVAVPLGVVVYFSGLNADIKEGDTITNIGATISFLVRRVVIMFGTTGTGDAIGYFVTNTVAGGPLGNGVTLRRGGVNVATTPASGVAQYNITLPVDSSNARTNYRFRRWNFSGAPNAQRIYAVNGQGPAFELAHVDPLNPSSGVVLTPIITGLGLTAATFNNISSLEKPTKLAVQADHLFLGYRGGTLQHSGLQTPLNWTAVQGADTRQTGDDIENLLEHVNGTLLLQTRTRTGQIYGDVNENFQLRWNDSDVGGYPDTIAKIDGCAVFLTDQGVMIQSSSNDFGNFSSVTTSTQVQSLLRALMHSGAGVIEATISRERSMYRLYFDDGKALSFCMRADQCLGIGYLDIGTTPHNFWSEPSTVNTGGQSQPPERILFCTDSGYVMHDDTGGLFAGAFIVGEIQTQFYRGQDNYQLEKRYRQMLVDVIGADAYTNLKFSAEYDDGADYRTIEQSENVTRYLTGGQYDLYSAYGQAFYGPSGKNVIRKQLNGQGVGISFIFRFSTNISLPFTIQAIEFVAALRSRRGWR
jgi:hypothetical protein